ncbi:MAG: GMC family oxidoreductase [Rhodobacteraceae bacterium]|nr:GMC family oxidoreductase [Paracoccaceae bacterium]
MRRVDLSAASGRAWDVVIVGSSFAAFFFARQLRGRDLDVLFVERGPFIDRETQLATRHEETPPEVAQENSSGQRKDWAVRYQFGGCSNCWWGNTPRFHPSDFNLRSRYGVAQDWPLSYDALEPYMADAEDIMEVAGEDVVDGLTRSRPYPYPPHTLTRAERRLRAHDPSWGPMPSARATGGSRAHCCASGTCSLCPIDSKFTILNGLESFDDERFALLTDAECREVQTAAGQASGITVRTPTGTSAEIRGDFIALAANPISNAAILLRSGIGGEGVGLGVHEQVGQFIWIDIPFDNYYGGTSITGLGYALYDGPFRSDAASVLIESWNAPPSLRLERGKWLQRLKLKFVAEDLPLTENRVVLRDNDPVIVWTGHSAYAYRGLERARDSLDGLLPFAHDTPRFGKFEPTEAHLIGGTPMAASAEQGVVDTQCRVFGLSNLACLGASSFPTGAAANPTLTIAALSLYAGDQL